MSSIYTQIHWPEPDNDLEEGWTELARLKNKTVKSAILASATSTFPK
jgi:aryl-alcohol dehydrogenase-like predicted oxidoreductase